MREELKGFTPEELERAAEEARALRTEAWDRRLQDDSDDLSDLHPVRVKTSKRQNARATVGLRLGAGELDLIERAAKARGITFSEFVRDAALMVASGKISDEETDRSRRLAEMRVLLSEFEASLDRVLDDYQ